MRLWNVLRVLVLVRSTPVYGAFVHAASRLVGLSGRPSCRCTTNMAFETEPTFLRLNVGAGIVRCLSGDKTLVAVRCQFATFGPRQFDRPARLARTHPPEANCPLLKPLDGAVALVGRGKCSFETKVRIAAASGASGVILMNTDDSRFIAAPDEPGLAVGPAAHEPSPDIPLVVVSSGDASRLTDAYDAAYAAEIEGEHKETLVSVTQLTNDESLADALRLPLFPVGQTLLPGELLRIRVSPGERLALQTRFQLALQGPPEGDSLPEDLGVATVAVVLVGDASSNLLGDEELESNSMALYAWAAAIRIAAASCRQLPLAAASCR